MAAGGDGSQRDSPGTGRPLHGPRRLAVGTVNVWARETGIPLSLPDAARVLLYGVRRRVDLGRAGNRYFLMMAGIGFDAEVTRRVEREPAQADGAEAAGLRDHRWRIRRDTQSGARALKRDGKGRDISALMLIIGNTGSTAARSPSPAMPSRMMACWMSLSLAVAASDRLGILRNALLRRPRGGPQVRYERVRSIRIEADRRYRFRWMAMMARYQCHSASRRSPRP